jgi:hypothetical protein
MEEVDRNGISITNAFSEEGKRFVIVSFLMDDIRSIRAVTSSHEDDKVADEDTISALKAVIHYYTTHDEYKDLGIAKL